MKRHLAYLKYVIRHKWFVFLACRRCGVSLWRALIHDWNKFLPCEWFPYADYFYGSEPRFNYGNPSVRRNHEANISDWKADVAVRFDVAWNHHQKANKHHWQYWVLITDLDEPRYRPMQIPERYAREMVADWWGAGRAITGRWDALEWYQNNQRKITLHHSTRSFVERLLEDTSARYRYDDAMLAKRRAILGY